MNKHSKVTHSYHVQKGHTKKHGPYPSASPLKKLITPISDIAEDAIENKIFPGGVIGVVNKKGDRIALPFGKATYEEDAVPVKEDTIYDTASITKSIPTASLTLQLIDEKRLSPDDQLIAYIPEFKNNYREEVHIRHLLTYTIDGYPIGRIIKKNWNELKEVLMTTDFSQKPGKVFKYSNIPYALLGMVIERITGTALDVLADERFFKPLGMNRTTFHPERYNLEEIAPTEINDWHGLVHGIVHDESARVCYEDGKIVGHAGLFSTAPDILNFLEMLLHNGTLNGVRYFSPARIKEMQTNQIAHLNDSTGLGFELSQKKFMGSYCSPNTFGKMGFTGTLFVCDVEKEIAYVILTNATYPKRPEDRTQLQNVRRKIGELILKKT